MDLTRGGGRGPAITARHAVRGLALSLALLLTATPCLAQRPATEQTVGTFAPRIEALVLPSAEAEVLSGVLLVAREGQVLFDRAYGFASWELRVPNSEATRFGIASITKPMTESVVQMLVREGRLDLDEPVEKYLPGFPRGPNGGVPTVRHLLTHRSGVPHRVTSEADETQELGPRDIVERVKAAGLSFEPGSERLYSSAGYTCLARVIEVVEGRPFETVLVQRVLGPAGMTSAVSETGQGLMPRRALAHRLGADDGRVVVKKAPHKDLRFLTGAGSVYATAEDMLRFVEAIRRGVFGEQFWDETFDADATTWRGFYGRTHGYEASVDVLPARNLVFVFLSNLQSAANWQIREGVRSILLGSDAAPVRLPPPVAERFEPPESLVGTYGPAEIRFVNGDLLRGDSEFYPIDGRRYYIPGSGTVMRFRRDSSGAVDALVTIRGGGRESVLERSTGRGR